LNHAPASAPLPKWQRTAATANHWALYAAMLMLPASGYLGSSFTRYPIKYFGHALPHWGWDWPSAKALMSSLHLSTACLLGALIALHIGAAVWHLARRDGVFLRMWRAA
jgi:cytochrome b561